LGFAGVVSFGVVGVVPPELGADGVDPAEGVVDGLGDGEAVLDVALADGAFFASGSGVKGSCAIP
jgi:hypothetical protein